MKTMKKMKKIGLDKNAQEAVLFLIEMVKKTERFEKLYALASPDERHLIGTLIIGVDSPIAGIGKTAHSGNECSVRGMLAVLQNNLLQDEGYTYSNADN